MWTNWWPRRNQTHSNKWKAESGNHYASLAKQTSFRCSLPVQAFSLPGVEFKRRDNAKMLLRSPSSLTYCGTRCIGLSWNLPKSWDFWFSLREENHWPKRACTSIVNHIRKSNQLFRVESAEVRRPLSEAEWMLTWINKGSKLEEEKSHTKSRF